MSRESGSKELGCMGQRRRRSNGLLEIHLQVVAITTMEDRGLEKGGPTIILRRSGSTRKILLGEASNVKIVPSKEQTNLPSVEFKLEHLVPPADEYEVLIDINCNFNNTAHAGVPLMVQGEDYISNLGGQDVGILGPRGSISQSVRIIPDT